ncbi:FHA domain containing protein [Anaeromyxobacter dehalogenans 2CP-1]|uniref:FHA domain containing protein n=1 Tax=Anaeromyxobacter dehalogenans (strain ATCC BAA-258 / DSM 21875 / 2CP-1) TaxID=455488 RepID=B8J5D1_ANAD2|nr:adventurous gliding motility protein GltG [Anaeromyxobacter dehalogenans]ACL66793.1 FHA domain containing protein [Anaeromyxobacter dehalogenans 2CP-1]
MATPITLKVFRGNELVRSEQFSREIIKIGRLASAHLVLDDEKVSRIHSVIEVSPDGAISIIDMGSAEGTFVNGKKVSRGALRAGDQITLGGLLIVVEGAAAEVPAPANAAVPAAETVNHAVAAPAAARPAKVNGNGVNGHGHAHAELPAPAPAAAVGAAEAAPVAAAPVVAAAAAVAAAPAPSPRPEPAPAAAPAPAPRRSTEPRRRAALRPADAAAAEDLSAVADLGVELRVLWGDTLLDAATFVRPKQPVLVGDGEKCSLRVEGLPLAEFPMLRFEDGDYKFAFGSGMTGVVDERGQRTAFGELVKSRKAASDEKVKGAYWIPVPRAGAVRAEVGSRLAIEARPKKPEPVKPVPLWDRVNYRLLNLFLVLFFIQSGFIVAANNFPYDTDVLADDLFKNPSRMAKFIIKPPEAKPKKLEKLAGGTQKDDPGEMAEKHKGDEGKMGKRDAPKSNARSAPRAIDPNAKDVVKSTGLLGALGRGGGGLSTVFGSGGLGGDLKGAVGNMFGPVVGDAQGLGGLGIRGSGSGGGGSGETIGIGAVGTKGRGGGLGTYGTGVGGLGKKGDRDISIGTGAAQVMGSIDKELVRKVIQDHAAQIRYCYEQQLAINPRLAGKVSIKWVIQTDGSATSPQVDSGATTLEDAKVHDCMMSRITSWQFPKPKGGGIAVITYPWILRSAGGE